MVAEVFFDFAPVLGGRWLLSVRILGMECQTHSRQDPVCSVRRLTCMAPLIHIMASGPKETFVEKVGRADQLNPQFSRPFMTVQQRCEEPTDSLSGSHFPQFGWSNFNVRL